jgi:salicylate hydroxylase
MALPSSRTVIIAGAGIGGLTAALALARSGFRALVLEQTERLEETGAGIQLSPNATRILIGLGLADRLRPYVVAPTAIRVLGGRSGREIVRIPLGAGAMQRYGAPYWVIHRGDLQAALSDAAVQDLNVVIRLGMSLEDFATHPHGVTVSARGASGLWTEHGHALIAADGLWSTARARVASKTPPRFAGRTAWRALVPAAQLAPEFREPIVHLWFGRDAHLVHYPVKGSKLINVVVITADNWSRPGWSEPASRIDLLARLSSPHWAPQAHSVFRAPDAWLKWALYETEPLARFARGAAALLGDAAHAMLPFLAQGAAMAIEDAAVAAQCLARMPDDPVAAWESYSAIRRSRTRKVQRLAARNGKRYHRTGASAMLRNTGMRLLGGERLLQNYDWLYDWRPPAGLSIT